MADRRSRVEKSGPTGGTIPLPSLNRFCVEAELVAVDS